MLPDWVLLISFGQTRTLTHNKIMPLIIGGLPLLSAHTVAAVMCVSTICT